MNRVAGLKIAILGLFLCLKKKINIFHRYNDLLQEEARLVKGC